MMSVLLTGSPFENCVTFYCFGILKNTINKKFDTEVSNPFFSSGADSET